MPETLDSAWCWRWASPGCGAFGPGVDAAGVVWCAGCWERRAAILARLGLGGEQHTEAAA